MKAQREQIPSYTCRGSRCIGTLLFGDFVSPLCRYAAAASRGTEILKLLHQSSPCATPLSSEGQQTKGQGLRVLASRHHQSAWGRGGAVFVLLLAVAAVRLIPGARLLVGWGGACVPMNGAGSRKQEVSSRTEQLQQVRCSALVLGSRCVISRRSERGQAVHARSSSFCSPFSASSKSLPAFRQGEFPGSKELTPLSERRGRWGGAA